MPTHWLGCIKVNVEGNGVSDSIWRQDPSEDTGISGVGQSRLTPTANGSCLTKL